MKNILSFLTICFCGSLLTAQVIITENDPEQPGYDTSSVLLGFGDGDMRGIILPSVEGASSAASGTFIFNVNSLAVEMNEDGHWLNLTDNDDPGAAHAFLNSGSDETETGVIIGADTTSKEGVLVLESSDKALVIPRVADPATHIKSPVAGTMVYDTEADMLAVYDGTNWSYWK